MGRLIDADVLREEVYSWGMNDYEPSDFTDAIDDAPTVEAIPKDQYEARLKADKVKMLEEIRREATKMRDSQVNSGFWEDYDFIVKRRIDKLKGE